MIDRLGRLLRDLGVWEYPTGAVVRLGVAFFIVWGLRSLYDNIAPVLESGMKQ